MTTSVDSAFAELDQNLNLDPAVRRAAQERHNDVRDELAAAGLIVGSFLQGSFARKTMLKPLKDVDIVCLLDPALWEELRDPDGPGTAMKRFKPPIKRRWADVAFDAGDAPAGKALRLSFPDCEFTVDLVPAFETDIDYVLVGDRQEGTWTPSNTRIQLTKVSQRNQQTGERFVHQVREFKALTKNHPQLEFDSGIVAESLMYAVVFRNLADKDAIVSVLEHAAVAVLGPVLEPAGDDDVTAKWTQDERMTAAGVYREAARRAAEALELEQAGDVHGAIDVWHSLFGDDFPAAPQRPVADTMTAWAAGSVSSTGRPSPTRAAKQQAAPGRSWCRARYGE